MTTHTLFKTGDADAPDAILDRNGEVVLALCRVCGGAEGSLPIECPGVKMTEHQQDEVHRDDLDFVGDEWVVRQGGQW